jgi:hypothetical protein
MLELLACQKATALCSYFVLMLSRGFPPGETVAAEAQARVAEQVENRTICYAMISGVI